jgi:erythromycin esterase-like protein
MIISSSLSDLVGEAAIPFRGMTDDFDSLLNLVGDSRIVLLGEATHGTHDSYRIRAEITKRLIREKGFSAIAVEADWPDAYRVNCYVKGDGDDSDAIKSLSGFLRFPTWMWRNADILDFIGWLRSHNDEMSNHRQKIGFYGLDLYSLQASMKSVISYLERKDPAAALKARERYACFDRFGVDHHGYARIAGTGTAGSCQEEVLEQLLELQKSSALYLEKDGLSVADELFSAEQNARLVKNAEEYYRTMLEGNISSWNRRDEHMFETLKCLMNHLENTRDNSKVVVWAHNSHIGDAMATQMGDEGEINIGNLVRQEYKSAAVLVGFTTYRGTVTAASDWGASAERKHVRPGLPGSVEELFHLSRVPRFLLEFKHNAPLTRALSLPLLERAIGVIYRPETERYSHYFEAQISHQFDAVIHLDETRAIEPLERTAEWEIGEWPETYPTGI